jgi:hypothetical protein
MPINLKCNVPKCGKFGDDLYLRHYKGKDYLVCFRHLDPKTRKKIKEEQSNDIRNQECKKM